MKDAAVTTIPQPHHSYIGSNCRLLIDGCWVEPLEGRRLDVINPATEEVICTIADATSADVDLAVKAARRAFESSAWRDMTPLQREKLLHNLADLVERHADELALLECLDNGKPLHIARSRDLVSGVSRLRYMAGWPSKLEGRVLRPSYNVPGAEFHAFSVREPVGVVAQIVPWNFPLQMAIGKIAPALAAGCTCILKPAEQTSLTALRLGELVMEAGFPPGVVNIITGRGATAGAALVEHPDVDKIAFTGSTATGRRIGAAALSQMKRVSLELGGKSPVIIGADADLDLAIPGAANAIFYNQGQVCIAGSRLFAHEAVFEDVVAGISRIVQSMKIGNGLDPNVQQGPLVSGEHMERVLDYMKIGAADGEIVTGGNRIGNRGYFVAPTVVKSPKSDSRCVREEIFGPVLVANAFSSTDDIVMQANDTDYGLAASVWSRDYSFAMRVVRRLKAGNIWINAHGLQDAAIPFGGFKQSGLGRENGMDGVLLYTENKSVVMRI